MTTHLVGRCLRVILFRLSKVPGPLLMEQTCAVLTMPVAAHMILPMAGALRSSRRDYRASAGFSATARPDMVTGLSQDIGMTPNP
jgi:hypothetical protein